MAIYASPIPSVRKLFWDYLVNPRSNIPDPWLLVGHFNEITSPSEVKGGSFCSNRAAIFNRMIDSCKLIDLGFKGPTFTWHRSVNGYLGISKRLDRALGDCKWRTAFPEASCMHLHRLYSDHNPLFINLFPSTPRMGPRPFRFEVAWVSHPRYEEVAREAWFRKEGSVVDVWMRLEQHQ